MLLLWWPRNRNNLHVPKDCWFIIQAGITSNVQLLSAGSIMIIVRYGLQSRHPLILLTLQPLELPYCDSPKLIIFQTINTWSPGEQIRVSKEVHLLNWPYVSRWEFCESEDGLLGSIAPLTRGTILSCQNRVMWWFSSLITLINVWLMWTEITSLHSFMKYTRWFMVIMLLDTSSIGVLYVTSCDHPPVKRRWPTCQQKGCRLEPHLYLHLLEWIFCIIYD